MVELKNIKFIPEETKKSRKASRDFHHFLGSQEKYEAALAKPLKFPKHMTVWLDRDHPFKCRGKWQTVWRTPKGRFAKRPALGERAEKLALKKYQ